MLHQGAQCYKRGCLREEARKTINQARFEHHALLPVVQRLATIAMSMAFFCYDKKDVYEDSKDPPLVVGATFAFRKQKLANTGDD